MMSIIKYQNRFVSVEGQFTMRFNFVDKYRKYWEHKSNQKILHEIIKALQDGAIIPDSFYSLSFAHKSHPKLNLKGSTLEHLNITEKNLNNILFSYANIRMSQLIDCDFDGSEFIETDLTGANLTGCNFQSCLMLKVNLSNANLSNAILTNANLIGANLTNANLTGADLRGANLYGVNLTGTILTNADLRDAKFGKLA